jgi:hypothetical protein
MLHLPGLIERLPTRQRGTANIPNRWIDLEREYCGIRRNHAFCQTVLMVEPGRRNHTSFKEAALGSSVLRLRQAWPIFELHPQQRMDRLAIKLARTCGCWDLHLSREPRDLLDLLQSLKNKTTTAPSRSQVSVTFSHHLAERYREAV